MIKKFPGPAFVFLSAGLLLSLPAPAQVPPDSAGRRQFYQKRLDRELVKADSLWQLVTDSFRRAGADIVRVRKSKPGKLLDTAIRSGDLAMDLADSVGDRRILGELYKKRSPLEAMHGDYEQAHAFYITGWNINDSVNSQQKKNELSELKGKQDLETRDKEIALNNLQAAVQRRAVIGLASGIVLLCVIGLLLFRENRRRKKTSTTLLVLNNQLEEANRIKARFFGILSHDLRSPIANLLGFLHLVKTEPEIFSDAEQEDHQQGISRSAEELLETMEAMLLWSKEQMDSFKPDLRQIPVSDLFDYLQKFFGAERSTTIEFSDPDRLVVSGDENYLRVIMQNLTSNALKALRNNPSGLIVWKAVSRAGQPVLSISDNGPGMSKEQAGTLYAETSAVNARSGFGFHLVRDLAKAIRYRISVDSEPGKGTTFTLQSVRRSQPADAAVPA